MTTLIYIIITTLINLYMAIIWSNRTGIDSLFKMALILTTLFGLLLTLGYFPPEQVADFFRGKM